MQSLPDEVAQMSDSETACKYCGISYLLLNKYEQMQNHVKHLEAQFHSLEEFVNERPTLLSRLEILQKQQKDQSVVLKELSYQLDTSCQNVRVRDEKIKNLEIGLENTLIKFERSEQLRQAEKSKFTRQREQTRLHFLQQLKLFMVDIKEFKTLYLNKFACLNKSVRILNDAFQFAKKDITEKANSVYLKKLGKVKKVMQDACLTQHKTAQEARTRELEKCRLVNLQLEKDLTAARENFGFELEARDVDINNLKQELGHVTERLLISNNQLSSTIDKTDKLKDKFEKERNLYKERIDVMEKEIIKKSKLLESEQKLVAKLQTESEEKAVVSTEKAVQDANKALAQKDESICSLQKTLSNLEMDYTDLKIDREKTVEAHQSRIKQLQDKFLEQIEQAKRSCSDSIVRELEGKMKLDRDRLENEKNEIIHSLSDLHEKSLKSLAEKLRKSETCLFESKELYSSLHEKFQLLESRSLEKSQALHAKVTDLELKLEQAKDFTTRVTQAANSDMSAKLSKQLAEIEFLKNTVRLECEERMGLLSLVERLRGSASVSPAASAPMAPKPRTWTGGKSSRQK